MNENKIQNKRTKIGGIILLAFIFGSFSFLLISPYTPNYLGQLLDEYYFQEAQARINDTRKGTIRIQFHSSTGYPLNNVSIKFNQTQHEFLFGAMFFHYNRFKDAGYNETYAELFAHVFNYALLPFYWTSWESPDYYPEEWRVNQSLTFCQAHNITAKGHTLVWNYDAGIPNWLNPIDNFTDAEIMTLFKERIVGLMQKYAYNISYWDVTNEMAHRPTFGTLNREEFIYNCFTWAREAVPWAHLINNDYAMMGHDFGYGEMGRYYDKLNRMNVPFDAIGMQSHSMDTDWIPTYEIWHTIDGFARFGKKIHITEAFVPSISVPITNSWKKGLWTPELQSEFIRRMYTVAFSHPACESIAWWGFEDRSNPDRNEGYGLVNADLTPKPSYEILDHLINNEWHTEGSGDLQSDGLFEFNGFYGQYAIEYQNQIYTIDARAGNPNVFIFTV